MQSFGYFRNLSLGDAVYGKAKRGGDMDTKELVERCRRGERQAMGLLYAKYACKLEQVSRKYLKNKADVQDVVHDSFVVILTSMDRLRDARKLESWMGNIVRNLSLRLAQQPILEDVANIDIAETDYGTEAFDYDKLLTILEQLPEGYKKVLKLSVLQGLSHKEIGELLGIAPHSSSSQLMRAKEMMRRNAKRCGILLLALLVFIVPFFLPEKEKPLEKVAIKTRKNDKETRRDSTEKKTEKFMAPLNPVRPRQLVAETTANDTIVTRPADTICEKPRFVPNLRTNDRLIAESHIIKRKETDTWHLTISFAGGNESSLRASSVSKPDLGSSCIDPDNPCTPTGPIDSPNSGNTPSLKPDTLTDIRTHRYMPLTFGLSFSKSLSPRWNVETGLRYTMLRSEVTTTVSVSDNSILPTTETTEQKLYYIGIPLKLSYNLWSCPSFSLYTTGGAAMDIPVGSSNPVLWSVNFGAGLQYQITPSVSLYTEPSLNYYLNPNGGTPAIRTDRPFEITIPVGLRLSW